MTSEQNNTDPGRWNESVKIWMRLGVTVEVPTEIACNIIDGKVDDLEDILRGEASYGSVLIDGDSYIPQVVLENIAREYRGTFLGAAASDAAKEGDVQVDVSYIKLAGR